ncbi:MAG: hypothetical protein OXH08_12270 [Gammaproteobacteria bacterium]|nr:hypothetical protein [Gammaproteobacteria bacterium]MDE0649066.1 hypothetical protein [Gammaproteobacteria bacterium]MXW09273.1 hypothetical protein [Gammaproteobacteria bacterium]MYC53189.1 hypothetical protein [Gammaproteobacteria bacterium]
MTQSRHAQVLHRRLALTVLSLSLLASPGYGQWIEPERQGWASFAMYYLDTREEFSPTGEVRSILLDGHAQTASSFLTLAMGIAPGVDIWVQPSYHRLEFADLVGTRTSWGFGDTRVFVRTAPLRLLGSDFPFAIRAGTKLPTDFDSGTDIIPLGDGQRDWEVMGEVGHSFWPRPFYLQAWAGYRWREAKEDGGDFGNERFFNVSLGGGGEPLGFKIQFEGWYGGAFTAPGLGGAGLKREMVRLYPSLLVTAGPGQVELGSRLPLSGQNLATGPEIVVGYFTRLSI